MKKEITYIRAVVISVAYSRIKELGEMTDRQAAIPGAWRGCAFSDFLEDSFGVGLRNQRRAMAVVPSPFLGLGQWREQTGSEEGAPVHR